MVDVIKYGPVSFGFTPVRVEVRSLTNNIATTYTNATGDVEGPPTVADDAVTFYAPVGSYRLVLYVTNTDTQIVRVTLQEPPVDSGGSSGGDSGGGSTGGSGASGWPTSTFTERRALYATQEELTVPAGTTSNPGNGQPLYTEYIPQPGFGSVLAANSPLGAGLIQASGGGLFYVEIGVGYDPAELAPGESIVVFFGSYQVGNGAAYLRCLPGLSPEAGGKVFMTANGFAVVSGIGADEGLGQALPSLFTAAVLNRSTTPSTIDLGCSVRLVVSDGTESDLI